MVDSIFDYLKNW